MRRLVELVRNEAGQDLVEFALAAALIGLAGYLTVSNVGDALGAAYVQRDKNVQALWEPRPSGK